MESFKTIDKVTNKGEPWRNDAVQEKALHRLRGPVARCPRVRHFGTTVHLS